MSETEAPKEYWVNIPTMVQDPIRMLKCVTAGYLIVKAFMGTGDVLSKGLTMGTALLLAGAPQYYFSSINALTRTDKEVEDWLQKKWITEQQYHEITQIMWYGHILGPNEGGGPMKDETWIKMISMASITAIGLCYLLTNREDGAIITAIAGLIGGVGGYTIGKEKAKSNG